MAGGCRPVCGLFRYGNRPADVGFEEAVLRVPVARPTDVVSITLPDTDDIAVLAYSSPADGSQPMATDQQYQEAAGGDAGAISAR